MTAWVLLALTIVCAYVAIDVLRWQSTMAKVPFSVISYLWERQCAGKSLHEQEQVKQNYVTYLSGKMLVMLVVITLLLANATYRSFMQ